MKKWGTAKAGTGVREGVARHPGGGTDPAAAGTARAAGPGLRGRPECARTGEPEARGFGGYGGGGGGDDDDSGGGKPERRAAGRGPDDAGAAGAERRPHEPSDCGHHIMLACAARREVLGRGAAPSPPAAMYSYNGGHGSSRTGVRRRDYNDRGEAAGNAG